MRRQAARFLGLFLASGFGGVAFVAACGARTGLPVLVRIDATTDADAAHKPDVIEENPFDSPPVSEGHPLDVMPECSTPTYCGSNPNYIYKCGIQIYQCSSLEQCIEPCGEAGPGDACAAECVNPCLNSLGENTSNGCEFYAVEMDQQEQSQGVCYAMFVVNQWQTGQPARLEIDHGGAAYTDDEVKGFARIPSGTGTGIVYSEYDPTAGLPQNQIAILFLSRDPKREIEGSTNPSALANCPPGVVPAFVGDAALHGTGTGTAFHIRTNVPIVAYQMMPYGGGHARVTGATLLLPINVWGTNYIATNAYQAATELIPSCEGGVCAGPTMAIIAQQDGTHVTIDPVAPIVAGGGLSGTGAQTPITYTVNKGQYLQFSQIDELTGSPIQADAPIAVLGGSTLVDLPLGSSRADHAEQMLPPVSALGNEYVAVRYRSRNAPTEESVPWRIVGTVDGTTLTYDPPQTGAPLGVNEGEFVEFYAPGPFVVGSQDNSHPFYVAQYMTGGEYLLNLKLNDAGANPDANMIGPDAAIDTNSILWGQGDPEFVNVVSPAQYLPSYTFFTDPTYPETNLVVVAVKDVATSEFPTVNLDCAGTLSGWQPVGSSGKYQFTRIDLSSGNYKGQNGCNNGVHNITASLSSDAAPPGDLPLFGVTIWGWGSQATAPDTNETAPDFTCWVSYAYPAGANILKLNTVVVPAK
jgi:IgGFc binding protein